MKLLRCLQKGAAILYKVGRPFLFILLSSIFPLLFKVDYVTLWYFARTAGNWAFSACIWEMTIIDPAVYRHHRTIKPLGCLSCGEPSFTR
jgi:hypothetical protein